MLPPPITVKRGSVKPVHLATGVFVSVAGGYYKLQRLNRVAMYEQKIQKSGPHKGRLHPKDPYLPQAVEEDLRASGLVSDRVPREDLEVMRRVVHQFLANDQAAYHGYRPHKPFGNDYSACDSRLITMDASHPTDGGIGAVLTTVLANHPAGVPVFKALTNVLKKQSALGNLLTPLYEQEDFVPVESPSLNVKDLAGCTSQQVEALASLVARLDGNFTTETQARLLIIGISLWVVVGLLRWSELALGESNATFLLADFTQRPRRALRKASSLSVNQAKRQIAAYTKKWDDCVQAGKNANPPVELAGCGPWSKLFEYLGKRAGLIQPRDDNSRARRYIEPMADTLRVLVMSCFDDGEKLLPLPALATRLRERWSIVIGINPDDPELIRTAGLGSLQEDDDIAFNKEAFIERLEELQLGVRLSDGEHRCAAIPEDLP